MIDLAKYAEMKICVAVSGGKDSMALLHYLFNHAKEYGITLSALNCDHRIRGEASARDSRFVKKWCKKRNIPLLTFEWEDYEAVKSAGLNIESSARFWRRNCYFKATKTHMLKDGTVWQGADAVATAHHMNDNAETVLFNLARGSGLSGMKGICEGAHISKEDNDKLNLIHPLICCTRGEIDEYISVNGIPFVEDESNLTDDYTRNKIRHNVLPELEKAVPNAVNAIYRFSRLAADDEQYFESVIKERNLIRQTPLGTEIAFCEEKVIFKRAVLKGLQTFGRDIKDYTSEHAERLYNLQFSENGKKFEFLNITAFKEDGKIALCDNPKLNEAESGSLYCYFKSKECFYMGQFIAICEECDLKNFKDKAPERVKLLKFDLDKIPRTALIRFMKSGDKFTKFGGGTKNLGDYFTDKKIPVRVRKQIPLIADGNEILAVGGVEICDKIKITENTKKTYYLVCTDYSAAT